MMRFQRSSGRTHPKTTRSTRANRISEEAEESSGSGAVASEEYADILKGACVSTAVAEQCIPLTETGKIHPAAV